jgi:hypothetical protein
MENVVLSSGATNQIERRSVWELDLMLQGILGKQSRNHARMFKRIT